MFLKRNNNKTQKVNVLKQTVKSNRFATKVVYLSGFLSWFVLNVTNLATKGDLNAGERFVLFIPFICLLFVFSKQINIQRLYEVRYLIGFVLIAMAEDLLRGNFRSGLGGLGLFFVVIVIVASNAEMKTTVINFVFVLSFFIFSIVGYWFGSNIWGFIPGQSGLQIAGSEAGWRISLFSNMTPPISGYYSLVAVIANLSAKRLRYINIVVILMSVYYVIFSGSRTMGYMLLNIIGTKMIFDRWIERRDARIKTLLGTIPVVFIAAPVIVLSLGNITDVTVSQESLNEYINRGADHSSIAASRTDIWKEYLNMFLDNPVFGQSGAATYTVETSEDVFIETETLLLRIFARYGIIAFLVPLQLWFFLQKAIALGDIQSYLFIQLFAFTMLSYSSFLTATSFAVYFSISMLVPRKIGYVSRESMFTGGRSQE